MPSSSSSSSSATQPLLSSPQSVTQTTYHTSVDLPNQHHDTDSRSIHSHHSHHSHNFHEGIGHKHYSDRTPWLRAAVLGANDGLVSVASIMMGVGGGNEDFKSMLLTGIAALVAGALSMACGEYVSVASQLDTEHADMLRERNEFLKGPEAHHRELCELAAIYESRGLSAELAMKVAEELHAQANGNIDEIVKVHLRDELNVDVDEMANPWQAAGTSVLTFSVGGVLPLLAGCFIREYRPRIYAVAIVTTLGLLINGATGSYLGGAPLWRGAVRVLIGGWLAMIVTFGVGWAVGENIAG